MERTVDEKQNDNNMNDIYYRTCVWRINKILFGFFFC
jgi:hypothetical protein